MKLTLKIPGGGYLEFEKKPMSKEARERLLDAVMFITLMAGILFPLWLLR